MPCLPAPTQEKLPFGGPRLKLGSEPGFYGESRPHILTYSSRNIGTLMVPIFARDLTVCFSLGRILQHFLMVVYAFLIMLILAHSDVVFPDDEFGGDGEGGPVNACATGLNIKICQLDSLLSDAKTEFRFLIAFILAGFVGMTVATWKERRRNYAALCGNARNLSLNLASFVPLTPSDPELMQARATLGRWVLLAFELAVLKARGNMDSTDGRSHLLAKGLCTEAEWDALVPGDRHSTVFWWIQQYAIALQKRGLIESRYVAKIAADVSSMRAQVSSRARS